MRILLWSETVKSGVVDVWRADRHQIADIHRAGRDHAVKRRNDTGIGKIDLGLGNRGAVLVNQAGIRIDRCLLRGELLLGNRILCRQRLVARQVHPGIGERGTVARQRAFCLGQRRLVGPGIDLRQKLVLLHLGADVEIPLLQITADLRIDGRIGEGFDVARQAQRAATFGIRHPDDLDRGDRLIVGPLRSVVALPETPANPNHRYNEGEREGGPNPALQPGRRGVAQQMLRRRIVRPRVGVLVRHMPLRPRAGDFAGLWQRLWPRAGHE